MVAGLVSVWISLLVASAPQPAFHSLPPHGQRLAVVEVDLPPAYRDRLRSDDGSLDVGVGLYGDCSRRTAVTFDGAQIDGCIGGRTYFIGHNPGPFSPLLHLQAGDRLTYFDGQGQSHRYQIIGTRSWNRYWGPPPFLRSDVSAQFQTCLTLDAVWDEILDAVEV